MFLHILFAVARTAFVPDYLLKDVWTTLEDKDSVSLWNKKWVYLLSSRIKINKDDASLVGKSQRDLLPIIKDLGSLTLVEIPFLNETVFVITVWSSLRYSVGIGAQGAHGPEITEEAGWCNLEVWALTPTPQEINFNN